MSELKAYIGTGDPKNPSNWQPMAIGAQGALGPQGYQGYQGNQGYQGYAGPPTPLSVAKSPSSGATVTTTSQQILGTNLNRKQVWVYNLLTTEIVYLSLGSSAATVNNGIRINPGGGYWTTTVYTGPIQAICTNNVVASGLISWSEV